jgi:ribonuclease BN (tRNA processing enzyme)
MRLAAVALLLAGIAAAVPAAAADSRPIVVTLGTGGGPVVQTRRAQPASAVVVDGDVYLFDAGEGTQRQLKAAGLAEARLRAVFLTHHHVDHVGGLAPLIVNRWIVGARTPLPVIGPAGTAEMLQGLAAAARPIERSPLAIGAAKPGVAEAAVARDLAAMPVAAEIYRDDRIRVAAIEVDHYHEADGRRSDAARAYAYRVEGGGRTIVFTGDTGPSPGLVALARGADLLVSEVMDRAAIAAALDRMALPADARAGFLRHMDLDHLTPAQVGRLAKDAGVAAVVLTHLVPGRDEETSTAGYTDGLSDIFKGRVTVAEDGDRF